MDRLSGDVAGIRQTQEMHYVGNLLGIAVASHWSRWGDAVRGGGGALAADSAGDDAVDGNALLGELERQRARQPHKSGLSCPDMRALGRTHMGAHAADIDDAAVFCADHLAQCGARAKESAVKDDAGKGVPPLERHLGERHLFAVGGVVHQDVDAAELLHRHVEHAVDGGLIGNVGEVDERASAGGFEFRGGRLGFLARGARIDDDRSPVAGKSQSDGLADAPHAAGDDRDMPFKRFLRQAEPPLFFRPITGCALCYICNDTLSEVNRIGGPLSASPSELSTEAVRLSEYIAGALAQDLPPQVVTKTKQHILDTLAAILSGSRLRAGRLAAGFVERAGGAQEATVVGTPLLLPAANAALANGMAGHADETDDSHLGGRFHPGCAIVPAALAVAEQRDLSGRDLIRAVALGYDIGARATMALYPQLKPPARHSTHSLGPAFGAAAVAAALHKFDPQRVRYVLSYAVQQASGIPYWNRDSEHVEKAFDFGGMGARNGVSAAGMVEAGFSAVEDPFSGRDNFFSALGMNPEPARLTAELGTRFEITQASIKK
jgi:hypothetical protein